MLGEIWRREARVRIRGNCADWAVARGLRRADNPRTRPRVGQYLVSHL